MSTTMGQASGKAAGVIANASVGSVTKWGITIINTNEVSLPVVHHIPAVACVQTG